MSQKTDAALLAQANIIKNETIPNANTQVRVGQMQIDIIDSKLNKSSLNTFGNGLNEALGLVKLGGTLTENTDLSGAIDWTQYGLNFWQVQTIVDAMTASYILGSGGASIYVQKNAASPGAPATFQIDIETDNPAVKTSVIITPASVYFKTALFELDGDALNVSTDQSVATKLYVDNNLKYNLTSPTTITVGNLIAGTNISLLTTNQILELILTGGGGIPASAILENGIDYMIQEDGTYTLLE